MGAVDTRALVDRARQGDREAFGQLYAAHRDAVFAYIQRRVGHRQTAEDITSDTFLRALRSISRYTWTGGGFGAWLTTIARNLIADHYKSSRARMTRPVERLDGTWPMADGDRRDDPEQVAVVNDAVEALDGALRLLTGPQRRVLALRYGSGLSVTETAAAMGCEVGAAKAMQHRAIVSLRRPAGVTERGPRGPLKEPDATCEGCGREYRRGRPNQTHCRTCNYPDHLQPCGTLAAYRRHKARGEQPCKPCQDAYNEANRQSGGRNHTPMEA